MITRRLLMVSALLLASPAWAHGPTPQTAEQKIETSAAPDAVWAILGDPASISDWHPDIASATMEGEGAGAKRVIELKSGGSLTDGIDRIDQKTKEIRWRLSKEDIQTFPASYYTNSIKVEPAGDGSAITWNASFFRADTTNEPSEEFSDEAAVMAMEGFIRNGLEGLKGAAEAGS